MARLSKWETDVGQLLEGKAFFFVKVVIDDDDDAVNPKQQQQDVKDIIIVNEMGLIFIASII